MRSATRTDKAVLAFSLLAAAYFAFIALDNAVFRLEWIGVGVLRELLTVPLIAAVAAVFVFVTVRLFRNWPSINACNVAAALILLALNGLIWGL